MRRSPVIILIVLVLLASGCARMNAPVVKQTYHDITGHYNAYFNANELYKASVEGARAARQDDYDTILSLYDHGTPEDMSGFSDNLSIAIDKATRSIQLHEISNWTDDAFLLIGKAQYVQGNYAEALEALRYITSEYKRGVDARSDKRRNKQRFGKGKKRFDRRMEPRVDKDGNLIQPRNRLFLHEAARHEALVWIVKTFTELERYDEASAVLTFTRSDPYVTRDMNREIALAEAHLQIRRGDLNRAVPSMMTVLEMTRSQKKRTRLHFITGQLYEETGSPSLAVEQYERSIKRNNDFEMAFMARLKLIQLARKGNYERQKAERLIARMLRDRKNSDYYDQLWYEKALWALDAGEEDAAIDHLRTSVRVSTVNAEQKARSFLLLARIHYENEDYIPSQANYDSTLALIDDTWDAWHEVDTRARVLGDLVDQLNTIAEQDSLLRLAGLTPEQRESFLRMEAERMVDAELEELERAENASASALRAETDSRGGDGGGWYFDNTSLADRGARDFTTIWGDRPLTDNWRRSAAQQDAVDFADEEDAMTDAVDLERDYYGAVTARYEELLAGLPLEDDAQRQADSLIIEAHKRAATIYKLDLQNLPRAIEMYEALLDRYPTDNPFELEAMYNLYLLYDQTGNEARADHYAQAILRDYPESLFARIIRDPDYADELERINEQAEAYYDDTYDAWLAGEYDRVIDRCDQAMGRFGGSPVRAKFALLKAMAVGQTLERTPFLASLNHVVSEYPGTEEEARASEIIALLNAVPDSTAGSDAGRGSLDRPGRGRFVRGEGRIAGREVVMADGATESMRERRADRKADQDDSPSSGGVPLPAGVSRAEPPASDDGDGAPEVEEPSETVATPGEEPASTAGEDATAGETTPLGEPTPDTAGDGSADATDATDDSMSDDAPGSEASDAPDPATPPTDDAPGEDTPGEDTPGEDGMGDADETTGDAPNTSTAGEDATAGETTPQDEPTPDTAGDGSADATDATDDSMSDDAPGNEASDATDPATPPTDDAPGEDTPGEDGMGDADETTGDAPNTSTAGEDATAGETTPQDEPTPDTAGDGSADATDATDDSMSDDVPGNEASDATDPATPPTDDAPGEDTPGEDGMGDAEETTGDAPNTSTASSADTLSGETADSTDAEMESPYSISPAEEAALSETPSDALPDPATDSSSTDSVDVEALLGMTDDRSYAGDVITSTTPDDGMGSFGTSNNSPYYLIVALPDSIRPDTDSVEALLRRFNEQRGLDLQVFTVDFFKADHLCVLSRPVQGLAATLDYETAFRSTHPDLPGRVFFISLINYTILFNRQDVDAYADFFERRYHGER